jgi:hypothetical protein
MHNAELENKAKGRAGTNKRKRAYEIKVKVWYFLLKAFLSVCGPVVSACDLIWGSIPAVRSVWL